MKKKVRKKDRVLEPLFTSPEGSISYLTDGNFIYAEKDGARIRLDMFAGHYYKLSPYNGVPILEVDGLRMHLVRDFKTPLEYSGEVVKGLVARAGRAQAESGVIVVLDTCMGLGYTAIAASKIPGVSMVVTCEISEAVIALSKWNPFSDALWEKCGKITVLQGSAAGHIRNFEDSMFGYVIHDPPRISHAPELYSAEFYSEMFRVCKEGGKIFHYTGSVGEKKGRRIWREVANRLEDAGFIGISFVPRLQGLYATKPFTPKKPGPENNKTNLEKNPEKTKTKPGQEAGKPSASGRPLKLPSFIRPRKRQD